MWRPLLPVGPRCLLQMKRGLRVPVPRVLELRTTVIDWLVPVERRLESQCRWAQVRAKIGKE